MTEPTSTERHLELLCRRSFLSMWAHRSPFRDQRDNARATQGKELCDLLAVFEDDVFLFSVKAIEWKEHPKPGVAWKRWHSRAIEGSVKQLAGAERWLRAFPGRVFADRTCTTPLPVALPDPSCARIHRIAVAHGSAAACRQYFGGGSGSLMLNTLAEAEIPFVVGREACKPEFVHVFDEATLDLIFSNLDTIPDFRDYILAKELLLGNGVDIVATGEEDLLARFLKNKDPQDPNKHGFGDASDYDLYCLTEGEWIDFEKSPQKAARDAANADSYMWDELIGRFAEHSIAGSQYFTSSDGPQQSERTLRILNGECRTIRRALVQDWRKRVSSMGNSPYRVMGARTPDNTIRAYTFLSVRREDTEGYDEYRLRRLHMLTMCTALSRIRRPEIHAHVGIGHGPIDNDTSEDVILIDDQAWSSELEAEALAFRKESGVLQGFTEANVTTPEYPPVSQTHRPRGSERNLPCPCGSSRKWKKCCARGG